MRGPRQLAQIALELTLLDDKKRLTATDALPRLAALVVLLALNEPTAEREPHCLALLGQTGGGLLRGRHQRLSRGPPGRGS